MPPDLRNHSHRPWPLPRRPWAMAMNWHDLLFMHWPVPADSLRPFIPPALTLDLHSDSSGRPTAWLGIIPFTMTGVRARFTPAFPWLGAFHELNVRTYVSLPPSATARRALTRAVRPEHSPYPGVWFFSLDAANPIAVAIARAAFCLPYFRARMSLTHDGDSIDYASLRTHRGAAPARFDASYRATGPAFFSQPDTLEHWLTERYCLYSATARARIHRADIHHAPWPLQPAECVVRTNTMAAQLNLSLPDTPPLLHFAKRLGVAAWLPRRV